MLIENDKKKIIGLMNDLFCGMYFNGYQFSSSFTLNFEREDLKQNLPLNMELYLEKWWFGEKEEWESRLFKLKDQKAQNIEESLQSFDLTSMRWSEGAEIYHISLNDETLQIKFKNGHQLNISCIPIMGPNWMLIGTPSHDVNPRGRLWSTNEKDWAFTCENGEYFARIPEQIQDREDNT